ncbi:MAG: hypothetical protein QF553_02795 [Alphaproteobacteria bacterium]|jgi:hypothetical protein|nr:hypothetical protein [Alphaproteobacteria bacterium]
MHEFLHPMRFLRTVGPVFFSFLGSIIVSLAESAWRKEGTL